MKKMKTIGAVLLAAGLALSVSGCSGKTVDSVKAIQESGVLKVAIVDSDNYYTKINGGKPAGLEPELIGTISSALGVTTEYQVVSKAEALAAVAAGTADVAIGCIDSSLSLSENHLLSSSYGKGFFYVVTEKGDFAQSAGAFANSAVGVNNELGDDLRTQLYSADGITLNEYTSAEAAAKDIKEGRIRGYVCGEEDVRELLDDPKLQIQNLYDVDPAEYVIVAGKEDGTLVNGINTLIAQFLVKE